MKQKAAEKGRSQSPTRRNVLAQAQALSQSPEFQQKKLRRRRRRSHERERIRIRIRTHDFQFECQIDTTGCPLHFSLHLSSDFSRARSIAISPPR